MKSRPRFDIFATKRMRSKLPLMNPPLAVDGYDGKEKTGRVRQREVAPYLLQALPGRSVSVLCACVSLLPSLLCLALATRRLRCAPRSISRSANVGANREADSRHTRHRGPPKAVWIFVMMENQTEPIYPMSWHLQRVVSIRRERKV